MKKSPQKVIEQSKGRHHLSLAEKQKLGRALAQAKRKAKKEKRCDRAG